MKTPFFTLTILGLFLLSSGCKDKQVTKQEVVKITQETTNVQATPTKTEKKTILCFGNSLTAGHGLEEKDAWPSLLQQRLDSLGKDYIVVNAGLSGDITSGGLNRLDWVLKQKVDVFFLELGANDMLRGLDVSKTEENLDAILTKVHNKFPGIPLILAGMYAPPNMGDDYENAFNALYPALAKKHGAILIPFFLEKVAQVKELNNSDGIHPNAAGSKIVLETVWKAFTQVL